MWSSHRKIVCFVWWSIKRKLWEVIADVSFVGRARYNFDRLKNEISKSFLVSRRGGGSKFTNDSEIWKFNYILCKNEKNCTNWRQPGLRRGLKSTFIQTNESLRLSIFRNRTDQSQLRIGNRKWKFVASYPVLRDAGTGETCKKEREFRLTEQWIDLLTGRWDVACLVPIGRSTKMKYIQQIQPDIVFYLQYKLYFKFKNLSGAIWQI